MKTTATLLIISLLTLAGVGYYHFTQKSKWESESLAYQQAKQEIKGLRQEAEEWAKRESQFRKQVTENMRLAKEREAADHTAFNRRIYALNQMLEREVQAHQNAEAEINQLMMQLNKLEEVTRNTEDRQHSLIKKQEVLTDQDSPTEVEKELQQALYELAQKRAEIKQLTLAKQQLEAKQQEIIDRQVTLEEEIANQGGSIHLRNYRTWSPNYRPLHLQWQNSVDKEDERH